MRRLIGLTLAMFLFGCAASGEVSVLGVPNNFGDVDQKVKNTLLIVGEGGPSGAMFIKAAETYKRDEGSGEIYEVHSGDDFVAAMADFVEKRGKIDHMEFFGHGNSVGLYVNQTPNVNGAIYANDPELNKDYIAGSIYELPSGLFAKNGWIKFNGCNVAEGYPEKNSLAQSFANHFDVDVVAPRGPTEFSQDPYSVDPIENSSFLDSTFDGDVYMVPTYSDKAFVVVRPQNSSGTFKDVRVGQSYAEAVDELAKRGLDLDFVGGEFLPFRNINYGEAVEFCRVAFGDAAACDMGGNEAGWRIRNLKALKMLTDSSGASLKYTSPWYDSYVWWANNEELLTAEFTTKKWYTRGEMAELTWNFIESQQ